MKYFFFVILLTASIEVAAKRDGLHAFGAMGITYTPSSFRIGYKDWEVGMLNQVFGFNKIFDIDKSFYSNLGVVVTNAGQPGVFTSMGYKVGFWDLGFRSELASYMDFRSNSFASALIGVTYGF